MNLSPPILTAYVDIDPANPDNQRTQPAWQISLKNEIKRLHNTNGAAVLEHEGVVKALGRAQVKTVVLPYPMDSDEFDALIVDAVINSADVEFVYGAAAERLNQFGGIGAKLYYSGR